MFITVLFVITQTWKLSKCPSLEEQYIMAHSHEILIMRMNNLQLQNNMAQSLKLRVEWATYKRTYAL